MSIRTSRMKAVPTLLKRLVRVEKEANLNDLKSELIKIKDLFSMVRKNEDELLDTLTVVDGYLRNKNIDKLMEEKKDICQKIRNSTQTLLPADDIEAVGSSTETFEDLKINQREDVINNAVLSSSQLEDMKMFRVSYFNLGDFSKKCCFLSLLYFPENAIIKKDDIMLWWCGFFYDRRIKHLFNELRNCNLIVPHGNGKCPGESSKFKINPLAHHKSMRQMLQDDEKRFAETNSIGLIPSSRHHFGLEKPCLVLDQKNVELSDELGFKSNHWYAILNVGASYLNFGPQWMAKMKNLSMLHLGRGLPAHSSKHHIEVKSGEFLKELRHLKYLRYLSLRGISTIFEVPPSILRLQYLQVLDLKACHNLETLPNDISSLRSLRQLDLSQCYLLHRMPKGIEKLTSLEVLKGYVISNSSNTPCRISEFANLNYLQRLSIHIGRKAVIQEGEFESLHKLSNLKYLKISWGVFDRRYSEIQINLPSSLKKLHLEGFPGQEIPEWLKPSELLQGLKVLNITGGKLKSMNHGEPNNYWCVEILRLKYLKDLEIDLSNLRELFPSLKYAEVKQILNHSYFEWSID
ncbi:hypothetical protein VNO78_27490 [Psophocarpus tetragonolobus]|uniref:Disease resistance R13L4/SHOC-2-like LRR domain-containing protein n=1 Tax=Psophocarpus tetragonolobus TaxID=3891 RepID=A0AAN9XA52_PSOTE